MAVTDDVSLSDSVNVSGLVTFTLLDDCGVEVVDQQYGVEVVDGQYDVEPVDNQTGVE